MNKYIEKTFAQNWIDQAFDMHWERQECMYTVSYMESWRSHICGYDVWDNRRVVISSDNLELCR